MKNGIFGLMQPMVPKPDTEERIKLNEISKQVRILNQVAKTLVVGGDSCAVIKLGVPQQIEVVQNLEMEFVSKIKDLPSPLRLSI